MEIEVWWEGLSWGSSSHSSLLLLLAISSVVGSVLTFIQSPWDSLQRDSPAGKSSELSTKMEFPSFTISGQDQGPNSCPAVWHWGKSLRFSLPLFLYADDEQLPNQGSYCGTKWAPTCHETEKWPRKDTLLASTSWGWLHSFFCGLIKTLCLVWEHMSRGK